MPKSRVAPPTAARAYGAAPVSNPEAQRDTIDGVSD
jgi:hypothetical protein